MKDEYYELRGWVATTGVLKMKTLEDLGLADLAEEIKRKIV
jgi:aldehyde:ferredoxin oxidoreductase